MRFVRPVLFVVVLSSLPLTIADNGRAGTRGAFEPSDSVSGLLTLVSVSQAEEGRIAILKVTVVANMSDTSATLHEFDNKRRATRALPTASFNLKKGEAGTAHVRVSLPREHDGLLTYKLKAKSSNGSFSELMLYNRIPPDDPDPCETVGDYIQCEGQQVTEVQP